MTPLRIGIVPYLNMLTLTHGMAKLRPGPGDPPLEVIATPPSRMMRMMENGELDIGMAPVAGVFDHPEWRIVGDSCIGSLGLVKSVLALSGDPPERWRVIHPDSHSRTSNALAIVLLRGRFGVTPEMGDPVPPGDWAPPERPAPGEAYLLIGTRALRWRGLWREEGARALDLGQAWTEWTGSPFVYAVWAARPGVELGGWMARFEDLRRENEANLDAIIADWPGLAEERLSPSEAREYLTRNIRVALDARALEGLKRFYEEGLRMGVFAPGWDIERAVSGGK